MRKITEQPYKGIIAEEWKRAKKLLPLALGHRRKPTVKWGKRKELATNSCHAHCNRYSNVIVFHEAYNGVSNESFVSMLRHEFAHLPDAMSSHGKEFMDYLTRLGGARYATSSMNEIKGRAPKYRAVCEYCGTEAVAWRKHKRRYSCETCSPHKWNEKYALTFNELKP